MTQSELPVRWDLERNQTIGISNSLEPLPSSQLSAGATKLSTVTGEASPPRQLPRLSFSGGRGSSQSTAAGGTPKRNQTATAMIVLDQTVFALRAYLRGWRSA